MGPCNAISTFPESFDGKFDELTWDSAIGEIQRIAAGLKDARFALDQDFAPRFKELKKPQLKAIWNSRGRPWCNPNPCICPQT
jgi:hypothetical protein